MLDRREFGCSLVGKKITLATEESAYLFKRGQKLEQGQGHAGDAEKGEKVPAAWVMEKLPPNKSLGKKAKANGSHIERGKGERMNHKVLAEKEFETSPWLPRGGGSGHIKKRKDLLSTQE